VYQRPASLPCAILGGIPDIWSALTLDFTDGDTSENTSEWPQETTVPLRAHHAPSKGNAADGWRYDRPVPAGVRRFSEQSARRRLAARFGGGVGNESPSPHAAFLGMDTMRADVCFRVHGLQSSPRRSQGQTHSSDKEDAHRKERMSIMSVSKLCVHSRECRYGYAKTPSDLAPRRAQARWRPGADNCCVHRRQSQNRQPAGCGGNPEGSSEPVG
jgi:hypothetical protein